MFNAFISRTAFLAGLLLSVTGCSSLGLSLFPTGHYLTEQSEEILSQSPRSADIPRELSMDVEPVHYLQPGDVMLIEPVELDSDVRIPADQKVLVDGSVDLAKYGRVVVAGMTIEEAESLIEQAVVRSGEVATQVNVRLLDPVHRYYVLGEVNSPGSYPMDGHESVLDGILAAGGLTSAAAPCKILLARPTSPESCRVTLPVCYREITQLGDTTTNYQLRPGDRIFVATRSCCEDLMFWQATKTCDRCCRCQSACQDPNMVGQVNPMSRVARAIVSRTSTEHGAAGQTSGSALPSNSKAANSVLNASPSDLPAGKTIALPAVNAVESSKTPTRLPSPVDGELNFDDPKPLERFAPMWVAPVGD